MRKRAFRLFTVVLLALTAWTAYANVFSDDTALRIRANDAAREAAGCGRACRVTGVRGDRGMLEERIDYDVDAHGTVTVVCRRPFLAFGDHVCRAESRSVSPR